MDKKIHGLQDEKIQDLKDWVQHRIDYWEDVCNGEKYRTCQDKQEYEGQLAAYHRMQQHINTTFGEWVKSE